MHFLLGQWRLCALYYVQTARLVSHQSYAAAVRDLEEARVRHIQDSLTVLPLMQQLLEAAKAPKLLDVGSGAGFPGVVLALAQPDWQVSVLPDIHTAGMCMQAAPLSRTLT